MLGRHSPSISLVTPAELKVSTPDSLDDGQIRIAGEVLFWDFCSAMEHNACTTVYLIRTGQLKSTGAQSKRSSKHRTLSFLKFKNARDVEDFESVEKLAEICLERSTTTSQRASPRPRKFDMLVPSPLVVTAALPQVEIQYTLVAKCSFSNDNTLWTTQPLKVSRNDASPLQFQPTPLTTFPESRVSMKVALNTMSAGRHLHIKLLLGGLEDPNGADVPSVSSLSWTRESETRRKVPHLIKWELEEKNTVLSGQQDAECADAILASTARRSEGVRTIAKGKFQPCLIFPDAFKKSVEDGEAFDMQVPFEIRLPADIELASSTELSVSGNRILDTVPCTTLPSEKYVSAEGVRFAHYQEYRLRIHVEIGEDIYHKGTGSLVHRKAPQHEYTVVCHSVPPERLDEVDEQRGPPPPYEAAIAS